MNESRSLTEIERRAYQTIWEDGLLDVFVGAAVVAMGVSWVVGLAVWGALLPALLVPVWQVARKQIVEPRSGYVEFGPERKSREKRHLGVLLLLGVLTLLLGVGVFWMVRANPRGLDSLLPEVIPALPAVLLGLGGALTGLLLGIRRFLVYAGLLLVGGVVGAYFQAEPGWHFLVPGGVILIVGVGLLVSFLMKYPMAEVESLS